MKLSSIIITRIKINRADLIFMPKISSPFSSLRDGHWKISYDWENMNTDRRVMSVVQFSCIRFVENIPFRSFLSVLRIFFSKQWCIISDR